MDATQYIPFLEELFNESSKVITPYFYSGDVSIETKADDSPVTVADKKAEECIRSMIQKELPDHGIIGEEFGKEKEGSEYTWIIDPIDGTKAFITGCPLFTTLIGLLHNGEPILGGINQPIVKLMCIGDNHTTSLNGNSTCCRNTSQIESAILLGTSIRTPRQYQDGDSFFRLTHKANLFRTWGDGYGYLLVATGKADAMLDPIVNPWDVLPVIPVIRGSGAKIGNWQGKGNGWDSSVAATPGLFDEIIRELNAA
ncbi:MAG: histidinol-phosphatase [Opitutaceae bacterium]|nr:histidinol-phosphatase [Opitutaceae bacterium]|tara:strand:+ start:9795 stop:10559 length:765 start_codon:yes stop_codon:yes gene_type:complete